MSKLRFFVEFIKAWVIYVFVLVPFTTFEAARSGQPLGCFAQPFILLFFSPLMAWASAAKALAPPDPVMEEMHASAVRAEREFSALLRRSFLPGLPPLPGVEPEVAFSACEAVAMLAHRLAHEADLRDPFSVPVHLGNDGALDVGPERVTRAEVSREVALYAGHDAPLSDKVAAGLVSWMLASLAVKPLLLKGLDVDRRDGSGFILRVTSRGFAEWDDDGDGPERSLEARWSVLGPPN